MYKICSAQFNYRHGKRMHFPFSIASLVAFLKNNEQIKNNFKFEKSFIFRDNTQEYIEKSKGSDMLLCSCYAWNWEVTLYTAKEVKRLNPNCLIILGGPQVPNRSEGFFQKYPFVDILVHGEGELVIANVFKAYLSGKDFSEVKGIETKDFRNPSQERIDEDILPSPYLTNVIWELVDRSESEKWAVNWETNRGCPYGCTFCDWGAAVFNKTKRFSEEKLYKEIDWFAENKLSFIECCDANFGIFNDRDLKIAKKLKDSALQRGYPQYFHSAWAKVASEKIIPIAKELKEGGLLRSVTLALQSLDENALKIVKRANIKFDKFSELTKSFQENGIPTYTEIIRGLPGETLQSFKNGLEVIASDANISTMYIYSCAIYVNAPMNEPTYKEFYKIQTTKSPMYMSHVTLSDNDLLEYEEIVLSTSSFTFEELKEMHRYSWMILAFQIFGILEYISKYYNQLHSLEIINFYDIFLEYCKTNESIFSSEYKILSKYIDDGYAGKGWNHQDLELGEIVWPIEEASWLRITHDKNMLREEIIKLMMFIEDKINFKTPLTIIADLVKFQVYVLTTRNEPEIKLEHFSYDWKHFFTFKSQLKSGIFTYHYMNKVIEKDPIIFNYNAIWYGRDTQQFKTIVENIQDKKFEEHKSNYIFKPVSLLSP